MNDNVEQLIYEMPQGILNWYDFKKDASILLIYHNNSTLLDMLKAKDVGSYICASIDESIDEVFQNKYKKTFDYIIAISVLELSISPSQTLAAWKNLVKEDGFLLLGTDNRLGLRYFIGEKDPFTDKVFDGVENYRNVPSKAMENLKGRCYSKFEIESFLSDSGWFHKKRFSVLPNLQYPQLIYSETYTPKEVLPTRYFPKYRSPSTIFLHEEFLYDDFIKNGIFHEMANSFLFICSVNDIPYDVEMVTVSMDRGRNNALATVIKKDTVEKIALFDEGQCKLQNIIDNNERLKKHGLYLVDAKLINNRYEMPYIEALTADKYFQSLMQRDIQKFISEMDRFKDLIFQASKIIRTDEELGPIVDFGYPDLVPLNCFYKDGDFVFFDQEFSVKEYPVFITLWRAVCIAYGPAKDPALSIEFFFNRYGLSDKLNKISKKAQEFTDKLRNQYELVDYNKKVSKDWALVYKNKERMNMSEKNWEESFYNPFVGLEDKKLFLFGSGKFAEKFIAMYQHDYDIAGIFDNNPAKWNTQLEGYTIYSPEEILKLQPAEYKIIICMKDYQPVMTQLKEMGTPNIGVYNNNKVYPGRQACAIYNMYKDSSAKKKYHIGYIAGVFDLYHLGHLNMFKRAKEQCDYLIVGVVSDRGVREFKKKEPFIPFEERIEMVRSCRFVDEAVEIPFIYRTTKEAFEKYHFDVQFSGSDYQNDSGWLDMKKWLESQGADLVFFPYTQQTSSTKIKALIEKGLL